MSDNISTWKAAYMEELAREVLRCPGDYICSSAEVPETVDRMTAGFLEGRASKNSNAIRRTCKRLGIPYTYAGISAFLKGA